MLAARTCLAVAALAAGFAPRVALGAWPAKTLAALRKECDAHAKANGLPPELGKAGCACVVTRLQERFPSPPKRAAAYDAAATELVEACFTEEADKASLARMRDPVTGGWSAETCLTELARSTDIDAVARGAEAGEKAGQSRVAAVRKVLVEAAGKAARLNKAGPVVGYDEQDIARDLNAAYGRLVEAERAYREACRACAPELSCDYDRLMILSGGPAQPSPEGPCAAR